MKSTPKTRNLYNMFEISSLIQKALRRRDAVSAYFAANEMAPSYRSYLWKRLFTVSAEDCFDMVTGRILDLYNQDKNVVNKSDTHNIAIAVSVLLNARKNRDGDYFACNIFNSRDNMDLSKYCPNPVEDLTCSTKNGHRLYDLEEVFSKAIDMLDDVTAGYAANEISVYYPQRCWTIIKEKAQSLKIPSLIKEVSALCDVDNITKQTSTLFYSKAILLMLKCTKYDGDSIFQHEFRFNPNINLMDYNIRHQIPEYVYDCHTVQGKMRGKTKRDFVVTEQAALCPLVKGEYDDASWEHFFYLCDNGFYRQDYTPHPGKERIKQIEKCLDRNCLF